MRGLEHVNLEVTAGAHPNLALVKYWGCQNGHQAGLARKLDRVLPDLGGRYLVSEPGRGAWIVAEHEI